jgi:hypothetical protein
VPIVLKSGSLDLLQPSGPVKACNGIALPYKPVFRKKLNANLTIVLIIQAHTSVNLKCLEKYRNNISKVYGIDVAHKSVYKPSVFIF